MLPPKARVNETLNFTQLDTELTAPTSSPDTELSVRNPTAQQGIAGRTQHRNCFTQRHQRVNLESLLLLAHFLVLGQQ
ncbi:MAG: hypothetical protein WBF04_07015 [Candidatus Sulfotelmatobacter sp.]